MAAEDPTDRMLVAAWMAGDESGAATLVRRHAPAVGRYLASRGAKPADLDDLLQETFIKAFRAVKGWRGEGPMVGWLFRIAGNLLKDRHRRRAGRVHLELVEADLVDAADPVGELEASETADRIRVGLGSLSPMQREVFLLRVEQGMGYDEIAVQLASSAGAARVHYHNAVKRLKELVEW